MRATNPMYITIPPYLYNKHLHKSTAYPKKPLRIFRKAWMKCSKTIFEFQD